MNEFQSTGALGWREVRAVCLTCSLGLKSEGMFSSRSEKSLQSCAAGRPAVDALVFSVRSKQELREQVDSFYRIAELRERLQLAYPWWQPTEAHRFLVGAVRDIGARLHPQTEVEYQSDGVQGAPQVDQPLVVSPDRRGVLATVGGRVAVFFDFRRKAGGTEAKNVSLTTTGARVLGLSAECVVLSERANIIVERSLKNVARYLRDQPVEITIDGELATSLCEGRGKEYHAEFVGALWALKAALYSFRDNEPLLRETFGVMRRNLPDMLTIFADENAYNQVMSGFLMVAQRSSTFRKILLEQSWLGLKASDVPRGRSDDAPFSKT